MDLGVPKQPAKLGKSSLAGAILPLVFLGISALAFFLVTFPRYRNIDSKKAETETLRTKEAALDLKTKKLSDLNDFKDVVEQDSQLMDAALPSEDQIPLLLTQIQQIAKEAGLEVKNLTYSATSAEAGTNSVDVQISADGNYAQTNTFFINLERAARLVGVRTIRLSASNESAAGSLSATSLDITLGLSAPFLFVESKATTEDPITIDIKDPEFTAFINKLKDLRIYSTAVDNTNIGKDNPFGE